jgi:hypothetical protein
MEMPDSLRNYFYISDDKVDYYLGQWDSKEKRKLAGKLGINVGVLTAEVSAEQRPLTDRIHRLNAVERKIRELKEVGSVYDESSWFGGTMAAGPALFDDRPEVLFLVADDPRGVTALVGSAKHTIGATLSPTGLGLPA